MFCKKNIHRTTQSFIFCVLILFHLCVAQDATVQRSGEDNKFLQFSATSRPYNLEETRYNRYPPNFGQQTVGQYYMSMFFIIYGIGLTTFLGLLLVCYKVATVFEDINATTATGATVLPPTIQASYTLRAADEGGIQVSFINTAYSSEGVSEVDRSGSDRPPDYSTVTGHDNILRNAAFPQVVTTHIETPPPMYENVPVFK